jgi:ketosteroid isomerase-like protein
MSSGTAEKEILAAEAALYRAMIAKDFPALEKVLSVDLVYMHSTGVAETKAEYLAGVARGLYDYEAINSRDATIRGHGDVAIMHGIVDMSVSETGKPRDLIHLLFTLVWVRESGTWRLSLRQATRIPTAKK